jgi:hypothetical protein
VLHSVWESFREGGLNTSKIGGFGPTILDGVRGKDLLPLIANIGPSYRGRLGHLNPAQLTGGRANSVSAENSR